MDMAFRGKVSELDIPISCLFEWKLPPEKLDLDDGQIHIWKVGLNVGSPHADYQKILSIGEQLRAARLISSEKSLRFQSTRSALRIILSIYVNQPPENIQFKYGPNGKPYLLQNGRPDSVEFNIAHSENMMVAAFSKGSPVGIDLEFKQPVSTKDWIVKQYFSKNDQDIYQNLPEKDKETAFLTIWTKKEAFGKAIGAGLTYSPQLNHLKPGLMEVLPSGHYEMELDGSFWFLRFTPEVNFTTAVAIKSTEKIKPFFWESPDITRNNQFDRFFKC